jgi:hypothetical protein
LGEGWQRLPKTIPGKRCLFKKLSPLLADMMGETLFPSTWTCQCSHMRCHRQSHPMAISGAAGDFRVTTNRTRTDHLVPLNCLPHRFVAPFSW